MLASEDSRLSKERRRRLGRYDTPEEIALPLVRWGLSGRVGTVLDPSFGGCNFLRAALEALGEVGADSPGRLVYGTDVDPKTDVHRQQLVARGVPRNNLVLADFFATEPGRLPPVDLVVGNPPYIRHHWFQNGKRDRAIAAVARQQVVLSGRANAWAYFLIHASSFLREGGRMVLLLPGAVLFADYAEHALDYVRQFAGRCSLVRIRERVFENAQEETVVLLVERWKHGPCEISTSSVESVEDLWAFLGSDCYLSADSVESSSRPGFLTGDSAEIWDSLLGHPSVMRLGDLAKIRIGVVTGANRFFICNSGEASAFESVGVRTVPILTRARSLTQSISWTSEDQKEIQRNGIPDRLLAVAPSLQPRGKLAEWIAEGEQLQLDDRSQCCRRDPWYAVRDTRRPEAFLRYMGGEAPRIVLNRSEATSTNSIHRLSWKTDISPKAIAVGACTSLFALACELRGRSYGGGVLKIEPGAAAGLPVPVLPTREKAFRDLDRLIRKNDTKGARFQADKLVLEQGLGMAPKKVGSLQRAVKTMAQKRQRLEYRR